MKWQVKNLGEICDIVGGGTPSKANLDYYSGTIPWVTVRDMKRKLITTTEFKITEQEVKKSSTNIISKNNVIIATRVGLGKVSMLGVDSAINQDLKGLIPKKNNSINIRFLFWWYKSVSTSVENAGVGLTVKGVKLDFLKKLPLPVPSLLEQQQIAEKLDTSFDLIDRAKANIEKNIQNAKELFQSKLNQVFSEKGEGWEEKKIEEVCESIVAGGDAPKNNFSAERNDKFSIPIYANAVKLNGLYGYTKSPKVTKPSLTIAARGSGTGFTCIRDEPFFPIVRLLVLTPNDKINLRFLKLSVDNQVIKSSGSAIPQFTVPMLKKINLSYPIKLSEQQRIIGEIDQISAQTELLQQKYQQKLSNLEELKKSILEKAFKGELA